MGRAQGPVRLRRQRPLLSEADRDRERHLVPRHAPISQPSPRPGELADAGRSLGQLEIDQDAATAALKEMPFEFGFPLRDYQQSAIKAVETGLAAERRSMLLAMATGTGKTKLAIALLYRLLATKRFRRICFVVDRTALGDQAAGEFTTTKIVRAKPLPTSSASRDLQDVTPETETKVHICTIQGLVKRVLYAADSSEAPPVDQYDLMVVDECHRGYLLDREMSDAELSFRGQEDYISKYRRVLEYFDAVKVGLTATPALHTTEIFGDPIFTYSYREAVIDGYLIDHEPPVRIATALARAGIIFEKDEQLDLLNTETGEIDLAHAPDEIRFEVEQFNKQVVTAEFNAWSPRNWRTTSTLRSRCWKDADLRRHRRPRRHRRRRSSRKPSRSLRRDRRRGREEDHRQRGQRRTLIRSFRNDADPKIAVTVDLLTTGIDVPTITNLVFLRRVNSRILYEQMIGRATRLCPEIGKEMFRIFDAVDLYPHLQNLTDMKPVVVNPSISFEQLVKELIAADQDAHRETIRDQLAVKLRRRLKKLPAEARDSAMRRRPGKRPKRRLKRLLGGQARRTVQVALVPSRHRPHSRLAERRRQTPRFMPISHHPDEVVARHARLWRGQEAGRLPRRFAAFVRDNINTIAALKLVVQRPRDLTRAELRELRLALDPKGYSEANLRRAWADAKNVESPPRSSASSGRRPWAIR